MKTIKIFTLLITVLYSSFLISCSNSEKEISGEIKIYAPKAPPSIPLALAASESENIKIIYYTDVISEVLPAIMKKEKSLFIIPTNLSAKFYNKNKSLTQLAVSSLGLVHILSASADVNTITDLDKKSIYIPAPGSSPDVISRYIFDNSKIKPKITYSSTPEIAKLLISGKIKTAVLPEPIASLTLFKNKNIKHISDTKRIWIESSAGENGIPQVGICGNSAYVKNNAEDIKAFLKKYEEAVSIIIANPETAVKTASNIMKLSVPGPVIKKSLPGMNLVYLDGSEMYNELVKYYTVINTISSDFTGGKIPDKNFIFEK